MNSNEERYCYDIQVLLVSVKTGANSTDEGFVELSKGLLHRRGFVFCPGIDYQKYHDSYYSVIRFHSKQVNLKKSPFERADSKGCLRWYQLPKNATFLEQSSDEVLCSPCKHLVSDVECQKRKSTLVNLVSGVSNNQQAPIIQSSICHRLVQRNERKMLKQKDQNTKHC